VTKDPLVVHDPSDLVHPESADILPSSESMKYFDLLPPVQVGDSLVTILGVAEYGNSRIAVQAFGLSEEGDYIEPFGTLSVNLPNQEVPEGVFFARDYSYHAKTHEAMLAAGVIEIVPGIAGDVGGHGCCLAARLTAKAIANPQFPAG